MSYQSRKGRPKQDIGSDQIRSGLLRSSTAPARAGVGSLLVGVVVEHAALRLVEAGEQVVDLLLQTVETRLQGLRGFLAPGVAMGLWLAGELDELTDKQTDKHEQGR